MRPSRNSSSQGSPPSTDQSTPQEDQEAAARQKRIRLFSALQENELATKKARYVNSILRNRFILSFVFLSTEQDTSQRNSSAGRGFRKVVALFDDISKLVADSDKYAELLDEECDAETVELIFDGMDEEEKEVAMRE